jgi:methylmalonyl-CoA/ethylmalonyl-CoA epimerase
MFPNKTLAHVGYVVRNMESAIKRFEAEGGRIVVEPTVDPIQRVEVCLLVAQDEAPVELVAPTDDPDCPIKGRLVRGGGLDHICYFVDDLNAAITEEEKSGAMLICKPTFAVAFKRDVAFVHRRSGLVVEYMTRSETSGEQR